MDDPQGLLTIAEILSNEIQDLASVQTDFSIEEVVLWQSLQEVRLTMDTVISQIKQIITIQDRDKQCQNSKTP